MNYINYYLDVFKSNGHLHNAWDGDDSGHYVFLTGKRIKSGKHYINQETDIKLSDYKIYNKQIYYYKANGIADNILYKCDIEFMTSVITDWYNEYKEDTRFVSMLVDLWRA